MRRNGLKIKIILALAASFLMQLSFAKTTDLISIDLQNVSLQDALHIVAARANINLIVSPHVNGSVSLQLHDMTAMQMLDLILHSQGLIKELKNQAWVVMPQIEWMQEQQTAQKLQELSPLVTRVWQIHYAAASDIANLIQDKSSATLLTKRGSVHVDMRTNRICIQDTQDQVAAMSRLIARLDVPVQQVMIAARLASVDSDFERELGINFSVQAPTQDPQSNAAFFSSVSNHYSLAVAKLADGSLLDMQLAALEKEGHGELISSPSLFTANQQTASIESGEEIPYQQMNDNGVTSVVFKKAVLSLKVTPQVLPDHRVLLQLDVNQDRPSERIVLGVPAITTRQISTRVLVASGHTIVLGGIFESANDKVNQRIPFLSKIPLLGLLFQQKNTQQSKRELLIFVTPKIIPN